MFSAERLAAAAWISTCRVCRIVSRGGRVRCCPLSLSGVALHFRSAKLAFLSFLSCHFNSCVLLSSLFLHTAKFTDKIPPKCRQHSPDSASPTTMERRCKKNVTNIPTGLARCHHKDDKLSCLMDLPRT